MTARSYTSIPGPHSHHVQQVGVYEKLALYSVWNETRLLTQWVRATQLWLLRILASQLVPNTVQELHIALMWVLLQGCDEGPAHGAGSLTSNTRVLTGLLVFAARPHDDICWACLRLLVAFVCVIAVGHLLEDTHC